MGKGKTYLTAALIIAGFVLSFEPPATCQQRAATQAVSIVVDAKLSSPPQHGLNDLIAALRSKGVQVRQASSLQRAANDSLIVVGPPDSESVRKMARSAKVALPSGKEALLVHNAKLDGKRVLLISGSDDRGLIYALLDVAQQIRLSDWSDPLAGIQDASEKPAVVERAISKWVMNQSEFESYFYSEKYWDRYLTMLARDRYNTFVLAFGWDSDGYFDPPYPFLFDVEEFPNVRVVGITKEKQRQNLDALNKIIRMAHERGLDFRIAIWTHIYRDVKQPTPGKVWGLTDENLVPYTKAALAKFLRLVPELDSIQFRVHIESSVSLPQQITFWKTVLGVIKDSGRDILVDMRAKGFTDDLIEAALSSGVKVRLTTKYWGENMGLPFHPTKIEWRNQHDRRHSYADLLRYPKRYKMHWRLWNIGTTRMLLWGDPEYARLFVESTHLYDGEGFEVHEPLAYKMGGHFGEPTFELLKPNYRYYDWEFERYWHFYQVFGRIGYNPDAPRRIWRAEFESRFGKDAAPYMERALHQASKVLPRIIAYNLPDLSAGRTWAEKSRWDDLPTYIASPPSDLAQFLGIEEAAIHHLQGRPSAKRWPEQTSRWFAKISETILDLVKEAESRIGDRRNKEFESTVVDLKVLAGLARYHSERIRSGLNFAYFEKIRDLNALNAAIDYEQRAVRAWEQIAKITDGVYADNLVFGARKLFSGHWKDELAELRKGLEELKRRKEQFKPEFGQIVARFDFGDGPVEEGFTRVTADDRYHPLRGGYGWLHRYLLPSPAWKAPSAGKARDHDFVHGPPPMTYAHSAFAVDLPNGKYELTFTMFDGSGKPRDYGPMWIVANGKDSTERFVVPAGQLVEKRLTTIVDDNRLNVVFNSNIDSFWLVNSMVVRKAEPAIAHVPVRRATGLEDLLIRATVAGPEGIESVRLVYGSSQRGGYKRVEMRRVEPYIYEAIIPRSELFDGVCYFIEASDPSGYASTYPSGGGFDPIRVAVTTDDQAPRLVHAKIKRATAGKPLLITAEVTDTSGVKAVLLRYRAVNQQQDFRTILMLPAGGDRYQAEIPGWDISPTYDLMYYFEVFDKYDNGAIHPDLEEETPYVVVRVESTDSAVGS